VPKLSRRIIDKHSQTQHGKIRPRDLIESTEAGSVGATPVSSGWVFAEPEDGMYLNLIPKNVSADDTRHGRSDFPERLVSVQEAARLLGLSASNLNKRRGTGDGPRFMKLGRRVLYDLRDLEAWAAEAKSHLRGERSPATRLKDPSTPDR